MSDRGRRHEALRRLLRERSLGSQREVRDALADRGIRTTQATVSRDLDRLGAVKARDPDGTLVYRLRDDLPGPPGGVPLDDTLRRFVVGVTASGNLVVLRTPPACAQPVASAIDLAGLDDVIATVAGDDTVLVVSADGVRGVDLADRLRARLQPA